MTYDLANIVERQRANSPSCPNLEIVEESQAIRIKIRRARTNVEARIYDIERLETYQAEMDQLSRELAHRLKEARYTLSREKDVLTSALQELADFHGDLAVAQQMISDAVEG